MKKKLTVGCDMLITGIFTGTSSEDGQKWESDKQDVTDDAVGAVAQYLLHKNKSAKLEMYDKKYEIQVIEIE